MKINAFVSSSVLLLQELLNQNHPPPVTIPVQHGVEQQGKYYMSRDVMKQVFGVSARSDTNRAVRLQKMARMRCLKFQI